MAISACVADNIDVKKLTTYDSTERFPRSVIKFSTDKQKSKLHSTQKPLELCDKMVVVMKSNPENNPIINSTVNNRV